MTTLTLKCAICAKDHLLVDCPVKLCQWCSTPATGTHKPDHCYLSKCTRCLKPGHGINVCQSDKPVICKFCKEEGHRSFDGTCPAIQNLVCKKCGEKGHSANRCTTKSCTFCKMPHNEKLVLAYGITEPHDTADCPVLYDTMCGRCGKLGHTPSYCKKNNRSAISITK